MWHYLSISLALSLTACAGAGSIFQAECESKFREFPEIYQCTYDSVISRNPEIMRDDHVKLYLLRGEQLAVEVLEKKLTSIDARVAWQKLLMELRATKEQEMVAAIGAVSKSLETTRAAMPQQPQITPKASAINPIVSCRSTKLGTTIYTTCQ